MRNAFRHGTRKIIIIQIYMYDKACNWPIYYKDSDEKESILPDRFNSYYTYVLV